MADTLLKQKVGAWEWSQWPTMPMPSHEMLVRLAEKKGPSAIDAFHQERELMIEKERFNPLEYGWEQPVLAVLRALLKGTYAPGMLGTANVQTGMTRAEWKQVAPANDIVCLGGNGSGKTEIQGKLAMEVLESKPNAEARCFSQNEQTSIQYIQKAMFRYLRPDLRRVKSQGITTKISYKAGTGFSEGKFIIPSGSTALFPTYKGFQQDPNSVEGGECDIVTWDEQAPPELLETVRFRAHKKAGVVLGGFTPVLGYSETVGQYIEGGRILETIPARKVVWDWFKRTWDWGDWVLPPERILVKGCPPGHVPLVIESGQGNGRRFALVCPTMFNPYTNVEAIIGGMDPDPTKQIEYKLERLWGWPTKKSRPSFPTFSEHHVVKREKLPHPNDLTIYWWADPHGDRNWFMLWLGVDRDRRKWVIKEWPDVDSVGAWALPGSKPDGKPGPGQTNGHGKSFNDYKRLVLEMEGWEVSPAGVWRPGPNAWTIHDRRIDPRPAGTSVPSDEEARTYLDHLRDGIFDAAGNEIAPGLDVDAGPDCGIEEGKQWVNNFLTEGWNPEEPVTPMNCPRFYVSEECENLIWALKTWTGADGLKGACKDPIDCLKGFGKMGVEHVPRGAMGSYGGGSY